MSTSITARHARASDHRKANDVVDAVPEPFGAGILLPPLSLHPRQQYQTLPSARPPSNQYGNHGRGLPPSGSLLFNEQARLMPGTPLPPMAGASFTNTSPPSHRALHQFLLPQGTALESLLRYEELPREFNASAMSPPVSTLHITSDELPWELSVFAGASGYVRVKDIIRALRAFLETPVSRRAPEFVGLTEYQRTDVGLAFGARTRSSGNDCLRRRDFLKARLLCGLERTRDGRDDACVLILTPSPVRAWGASF